jgi:hypothetical protein
VTHVPLMATGPLQPPLATQLVAFTAFHVRLDSPRLLTVVGEALNVIAGALFLLTVTWRLSAIEPPRPVQVKV